MMHMKPTLILAACLFGMAIGPARAEDPVSLGTFDDWEAFTYKDNGATVCYVYSVPKKSESEKKIAKRDPVYFLVTNWPGRKIKGQISTIIGYPFKESAPVSALIDETGFDLYSNGDTAWAAAPETEAEIIKTMKTSKSLSVVGTSWKGTTTTDTYSLAGFSNALAKIDTSCK
jgi:hypothetical protein